MTEPYEVTTHGDAGQDSDHLQHSDGCLGPHCPKATLSPRQDGDVARDHPTKHSPDGCIQPLMGGTDLRSPRGRSV